MYCVSFFSSTGVFRIFPARHSRECGDYDPRSRPWYQASVSISLQILGCVVMNDSDVFSHPYSIAVGAEHNF